jgi:hypothetical protein
MVKYENSYAGDRFQVWCFTKNICASHVSISTLKSVCDKDDKSDMQLNLVFGVKTYLYIGGDSYNHFVLIDNNRSLEVTITVEMTYK